MHAASCTPMSRPRFCRNQKSTGFNTRFQQACLLLGAAAGDIGESWSYRCWGVIRAAAQCSVWRVRRTRAHV